MPNHDNDAAIDGEVPAPEAHGRAALLLVESLIHGLCEDATLSANRAVEIAERAVEVEFDQAEAADGAGTPMWRSHAMLSAIAASLRVDSDRPRNGDDKPTPPRLVM